MATIQVHIPKPERELFNFIRAKNGWDWEGMFAVGMMSLDNNDEVRYVFSDPESYPRKKLELDVRGDVYEFHSTSQKLWTANWDEYGQLILATLLQNYDEYEHQAPRLGEMEQLLDEFFQMDHGYVRDETVTEKDKYEQTERDDLSRR